MSRLSWRGERGEWYVVAQAALIVLVLVAPWAAGAARPGTTLRTLGFVLIACGLLLGVAAIKSLGRHERQTPAAGTIVTSGPFRLIRHPLYAGQDLVALGWALGFGGWLTLLFALLLSLVLERKAAFEERILRGRLAAYDAYCARTRRFIPFIF